MDAVIIPIVQMTKSIVLNMHVCCSFRNINIEYLRIKDIWYLVCGLVVPVFGRSLEHACLLIRWALEAS